MNNEVNYKQFYKLIIIAAVVFIFQLAQYSDIMQIPGLTKNKSGPGTLIEAKNGSIVIDEEKLVKEIMPEKKVLPLTWRGVPHKLVQEKIIDIEKLKDYSAKYGQSLTSDDLKIFEKDFNGNIEITPQNSVLIYNVLWAIGFTAQSPILDYELEKYGWDTVQRLAGYYFSFANLGSGSTLPQSGYNYLRLIDLTPAQKDMAMKIAGKSAVPSCGNALHLPDCSCSFAIDALILLASSQGLNEQQIYQAMKDIYPYRFPGIYARHAIFFKLTKNQDWSQINPEELVSVEFSSAQGVGKLTASLVNILNKPDLNKHETH